ncbi:MAG: CHASE2 domain-containing protein [Cyanobacteria bacterium P01_G01_bin.54]
MDAPASPTPASRLKRLLKLRSRLPIWTGNAIVVGMVTLGMLALRSLGVLQLWELALFDVFIRARPQLEPDPRIVIVVFDEADIKALGNWPIDDQQLTQLFTQIKAQNPRMIGLDIYRDLPVGEGYDDLATLMGSTPNLIGIQRAVDNLKTTGQGLSKGGVDPPPVLAEQGQVGANDLPQDLDGRIRRGFLYLQGPDGETVFSFAFKLAWGYLAEQGIEPQMLDPATGKFRLGEAIFVPLDSWAGGYVRTDTQGFQLLLNYRSAPRSHRQVSLRDVLSGDIEPDLFRDRIVLIGSTAPSLKDFQLTPYSNRFEWQPDAPGWFKFRYNSQPEVMTGVEIHANLTSFLLDAAQGERSLLRSFPEWGEWLLISLSILLGTTWVARWRTINYLDHLLLPQTLAAWLFGLGLWLGIAYAAFSFGGVWLPLVPGCLGLTGAALFKVSATLLTRLLRSYQRIEDYARTLELKVAERTEQLRKQNDALAQTLTQLQTAQQQMIAQERLASIGSLTAGVAHEIRNPLNFVNNFAQIAGELSHELAQELTTLPIEPDTRTNLDEIFLDFHDCLDDIRQNGQRIERIVDSMLSHTQDDTGQPLPTDLNRLLQEALDLTTYTCQTKYPDLKVEINTVYADPLPLTQLVPQTLSKALINLLTNAWEAMARRAAVATGVYQPQLQLSTQVRQDTIALEIQDNGEGIAPEQQGKIFDPFFTTKPPGEGTGLGLFLAHQAIVSNHQGAIAVVSEPGQQTQFQITLPIVTPDPIAEPTIINTPDGEGDLDPELNLQVPSGLEIKPSQVFSIETDV